MCAGCVLYVCCMCAVCAVCVLYVLYVCYTFYVLHVLLYIVIDMLCASQIIFGKIYPLEMLFRCVVCVFGSPLY